MKEVWEVSASSDPMSRFRWWLLKVRLPGKMATPIQLAEMQLHAELADQGLTLIGSPFAAVQRDERGSFFIHLSAMAYREDQ